MMTFDRRQKKREEKRMKERKLKEINERAELRKAEKIFLIEVLQFFWSFSFLSFFFSFLLPLPRFYREFQ